MAQTFRYDHYKVLGVPRDADARTIKSAYRERVKQCHPDRNTSRNAAVVFQAVHEAYATLSDLDRRSCYDQQLRFYRGATGTSNDQGERPRSRANNYSRSTKGYATDGPVNRFAFIGLHLTGLLFGLSLIAGIVIGCTWLDWPGYALLFCAPGIAVIPDSIAGLRPK